MSSYPNILLVGKNGKYRGNLKRWLKPFCEMVFVRQKEKVTTFFMLKKIDIFVLIDVEKGFAELLKSCFPKALVCLLTQEGEVANFGEGIHAIQKPLEKKVAISAILNQWHWYRSERRHKLIAKHLGLLQVKYLESQDQIDALHFNLTRDPSASFVGVTLRHEYNRNQTNICLALQRGCPAGCWMCASTRLNWVKFTADEIAAQLPYLLTCPKAFRCLLSKVTIQMHGGGDPIYCLNECCEAVDIIEERYELNARYIFTSIGKKAAFAKMSERLRDYDVSFEVSGNFADKDVRDIIMPATVNDPLPEIVDFLANDAAKFGRTNKYRVMLVGGINTGVREAERLRKLLGGTDLKVVVTNVLPGSLPGFDRVLTDDDGYKFAKLLIERGLDAYFVPNVGVGMINCGRHINIQDRPTIESNLISEKGKV